MKTTEIIEVYKNLLDEAMYLYQFTPNKYRYEAEEYFADEIKFLKKLRGE